MNTNSLQLQRKIMRRVYGIFAQRVLQHPITMQVALFLLALLVFARMVHVSKVIDNLLGVPVGHVPGYILRALMQGEVLTLIAIGVMVFVALSIPFQVWRMMVPEWRQRQVA